MQRTAKLIDGKAIAAALRVAIKSDVQELAAKHGRPPALGLIMVGDRKDSALYVKNKRSACRKAGIRSENYLFDENATQQVEELNNDPTIDGILVQVDPFALCIVLAAKMQLPLPDTLDPRVIIDSIQPTKDVDGLHPFNAGELAMRHRYPYLVPCTAKGIIELLDAEQVSLEGKTAVVLGRSNLVGSPIGLLLQKRNATVIQCHSKSVDLPKYVQQADVVIAACGQPYLVRGSWLKPGAVVIDVGINFVREDSIDGVERYHSNANADGFKIVGDVCYDEALEVAGSITPVPGGVGPMTIAMLLHNVVSAFKRQVQNNTP
ncbi:Bifunctional fold protein, partial [Globisporangium splendens]